MTKAARPATKSPNKVSSANYSQNWSIPNFEQLSAEEKAAQNTSGPLKQSTVQKNRYSAVSNPLFRSQTAEARNRQAALEAYTDSRSQSVVSRIAQKEVEGLRRLENVAVDTEALQNYAYQDNDTSFQEANFARLNRYISANHNDIYLKALRNKASSLVGENGHNITPRLFTNTSGQGTSSYIDQSSSYLSSNRNANKQTSTSYPSYQSYESSSGGAVVSRRVAVEGAVHGNGSFVTAQQARRMQQAAAMQNERKVLTPAQMQSQAARFALEAQERAQKIAEQQRNAMRPQLGEEEDSDKVLVQNSNTCIVSNSPLATAGYEQSERMYEEEVAAGKDKSEVANYGPRTVISVHESVPGHVPEELVEMDYVYSDDEIQAPEFLTEGTKFWEHESELPDDNETLYESDETEYADELDEAEDAVAADGLDHTQNVDSDAQSSNVVQDVNVAQNDATADDYAAPELDAVQNIEQKIVLAAEQKVVKDAMPNTLQSAAVDKTALNAVTPAHTNSQASVQESARALDQSSVAVKEERSSLVAAESELSEVRAEDTEEDTVSRTRRVRRTISTADSEETSTTRRRTVRRRR